MEKQITKSSLMKAVALSLPLDDDEVHLGKFKLKVKTVKSKPIPKFKRNKKRGY